MEKLEQLQSQGLVRPLDVQTARLVARLDANAGTELPLAAALTSWAASQGHTCLPLAAMADLVREPVSDQARLGEVEHLRRLLLASPVVGQTGTVRPLILDGRDRLALFRLHRCEQAVAHVLLDRGRRWLEVDADRAAALLDALFPAAAPDRLDWQKLACALALVKPLTVIVGGPGTGKTHTVARLLALHAALAPAPLRIGLAAPTGKAALRLQESIRRAKVGLPSPLAEAVAEQARTLHRLLNFQPARHRFLHDRAHPLPLDLLIIDEASMIDISLMAAVLDALPAACRLVLLGDPDQLASVEAGNVFADLCAGADGGWSPDLREHLRHLTGHTLPAGSAIHPMADSVVRLRHSYRFQPASGIGAIAKAVAAGTQDRSTHILDPFLADLPIHEPTAPDGTAWLRQRIEDFYRPVLAAGSPQAALRALERVRLLTPLREGAEGVDGLNALAETIMRSKGLIAPGQRWYRGLPVMVRQNDYALGLFNGDTGVLWPDSEGRLHAWFADEGGVRAVPLSRLPLWQAAYAVTVHKAQGSEFEEVVLVLPREDLPIVSRELLYTAITRARQTIGLFASREVLFRGLRRHTVRYSGLGDMLRLAPAGAD